MQSNWLDACDLIDENLELLIQKIVSDLDVPQDAILDQIIKRAVMHMLRLDARKED